MELFLYTRELVKKKKKNSNQLPSGSPPSTMEQRQDWERGAGGGGWGGGDWVAVLARNLIRILDPESQGRRLLSSALTEMIMDQNKYKNYETFWIPFTIPLT